VVDLKVGEPALSPFYLGDGLTPSLTVTYSWYVTTVLYHGDIIASLSLQTHKHGTQNIQNYCHQWLSGSFIVHQLRFRPGLRPGPRWRAYSAPPGLLAGWRGPTSRGGEGGQAEGKGEGARKRRTGNTKTPSRKFLDPPLYSTGYSNSTHHAL